MENDLNLSAFVFHCLASLLEHLAVPDETRARIGRQLEILRQLKTVSWTSFLAERAEHATRSIEDEFVENFFATRFAGDHHLDVHRNDVDAIFRTRQRAKVAGDAERVVRLGIHVESRRTVKTRIPR